MLIKPDVKMLIYKKKIKLKLVKLFEMQQYYCKVKDHKKQTYVKMDWVKKF